MSGPTFDCFPACHIRIEPRYSSEKRKAASAAGRGPREPSCCSTRSPSWTPQQPRGKFKMLLRGGKKQKTHYEIRDGKEWGNRVMEKILKALRAGTVRLTLL